MNTLEQQTFIDSLNSAEGALSELAGYAENLAVRLVGYSDETDATGYAKESAPSNGLLPSVAEAAARMSRKIDDIRQNLNRISRALPSEAVKAAGSTR